MKNPKAIPLSKNDLKYIFNLIDDMIKQHEETLEVLPDKPETSEDPYHYNNAYLRGMSDGAIEELQTIKNILYTKVHSKPISNTKPMSIGNRIGKAIDILLSPVKRLIQLYPNRDKLGRFKK